MGFRASTIVFLSIFLLTTLAGLLPAQDKLTPAEPSTDVPRLLAAGVPLRVYLTKRISKRLGEPVRAKLLEPVFAFDREVIPSGSELTGNVTKLDPIPRMRRASAMMNGDFSPLHQAEVQFNTVILPDGRRIEIRTTESVGLDSIYSPQKAGRAKKPQKAPNPQNTGILGTGKQQVQDQINARLNAKTYGVIDMVRGPDKMERLEDFLLMKMPYHPQWVRKGTRYDANLAEPLPFGSTQIKAEDFRLLGSQPAGETVVHARLVTPLDSSTAKLGAKVEAIATQPLFSRENKLIVPEGTRLSGVVTLVHRARWFHRGGQLRFNFDRLDLAQNVAARAPSAVTVSSTKTSATLDGAEASGTATVKVDKEGNVKVQESKTRFIAPAMSVMIASKAMDNDAGRTGVHESNTGGRTLGGGSGFGLLGMGLAQSSRYVGSALGIYGMAWSVYLNIVARGGEVQFANNAAVDIRFGARQPKAPDSATHLVALH